MATERPRLAELAAGSPAGDLLSQGRMVNKGTVPSASLTLYVQKGTISGMGIAVSGLDWDQGNREKCHKHGVSLAEIEEVLNDDPRFAPDGRHSGAEDRFIAIGRTSSGRPVFVAFTFRVKNGRLFVRPVSARYMHRKEAERYAEAGSPTDD